MTDIEIWKASEARAWAEAVRGAARRLRQREAALEELTARYDGLKATSYDKAGSGDPGDDAMVATIAELDACARGARKRRWHGAMRCRRSKPRFEGSTPCTTSC